MAFKFKSLLSKVTKPIANLVDPLLPESVKGVMDKLDAASGNLLAGGAYGSKETPAGPAAETTIAAPAAPGLTQEEAEGLSSKRLARLGRYFTSPIGVLGNASTGSQKVFS
jgi:hypothetical protein